MPDRVQVTPASFVFVTRENEGKKQILLHKRLRQNKFEFGHYDVASGHPEIIDGRLETPAEAGARELLEEYGLAAPASVMRLFQVHTYDGDPLYNYFFLNVDFADCTGEPKTSEPETVGELGWYLLDELPSPLSTAAKNGVPNIDSVPAVFTITN